MRLACRRCGAFLVPSWSGLRCPRLSACNRGGLVEAGTDLHPFADPKAVCPGVRA